MVHYRILAFVWLIFGVAGSVLSAVECSQLLRQGDALSSGAVVSTLIVLVFCAFSATTGFRLLRPKRWAQVVISILASLLILYCLLFLAMVGLRFGVIALGASVLGLILGCYSLVVVLILKPHE